jgi:predicted nucleic acid-binding protein
MREELWRVLAYPQIARRLSAAELAAEAVIARFDGHVTLVAEALKAPYTCKDPDDQKFIDLAVAHSATLVSKDAAVLCMARRLARVGVGVCRHFPASAAPQSA